MTVSGLLMSRQQLTCHLTGYLLLFGVELEALVQCAAVVLDMLLLLIPHALCVLYHLLLDVAKQAAGPRQGNGTLWRLHMQNSQVEVVSGLVEKGIETNIWYVKTHTHTDQSLTLCSHSMMSFTCGGPPELHSFSALDDRNDTCMRDYL